MAIPNFFKKLLFSRQFFYENGKFFLMMKVPGIILPMQAFTSFVHQYLKDGGEKAIEHVYTVGHEQGKNAGKRYINISNTSFPGFTEFVKGVAEVMGLGKITAFSQEGSKIIAVMNPSIFAETSRELFGKTKKPVCHYIRGIAAGLFEPFLKYDTVCEETYCKAKGDSMCRFVIKKR